MQSLAPVVVRLGMSLVFLWFGVHQLLTPEDFMGYLPASLLASEYASAFILVNGIFELLAGTLLLLGLFIRPVAFLLSLHLIGIIVSLGYNDIAVRDVGLLLMTISICFGGADSWSLDRIVRSI